MWRMNMSGWSEKTLKKEMFPLRAAVPENRERETVQRKNLSRYSVPRMQAICRSGSKSPDRMQDRGRSREAITDVRKTVRERAEAIPEI